VKKPYLVLCPICSDIEPSLKWFCQFAGSRLLCKFLDYNVEEDQATRNDGLMIVSEDVADGDLCWKISRDLQGEYCEAENEYPCSARPFLKG